MRTLLGVTRQSGRKETAEELRDVPKTLQRLRTTTDGTSLEGAIDTKSAAVHQCRC